MSFDPKVIKSSFEVARPIGAEVMTKFYEILWRDHPASKVFFEGVDMEKQKNQLLGALAFAVENCDNTDKLEPFLKASGKRHVAYGVKDEHYELVGDALLKTFEYFFKEKWTTELKGHWSGVYGAISGLMIAGSKTA